MKDKFGRECTLDLSPLLNENNVVMFNTEEQGQAIINAAIEQYPEKVSESWRIKGTDNILRSIHDNTNVLSFRGITGGLAWGYLEHYIDNPRIFLLAFDDLLQSNVAIPESDFGLEYIL